MSVVSCLIRKFARYHRADYLPQVLFDEPVFEEITIWIKICSQSIDVHYVISRFFLHKIKKNACSQIQKVLLTEIKNYVWGRSPLLY